MDISDYLNGRLTVIDEAIARETLDGNVAKLDCERNARAEVIGALDWLRRAPEETGDPPQRSGNKASDEIAALKARVGLLWDVVYEVRNKFHDFVQLHEPVDGFSL